MNIKSLIKIVQVIAVATLLAGCGDTQQPKVKLTYMSTATPPVSAADNSAQDQLAEAAASVDQSLQQLSAVQQAVHPQAKMPAPLNARKLGLNALVSVKWNGPVEPVLQSLANAAKYHFHVTGDKPLSPAMVNINAKEQSLAAVLRDINAQIAVNSTGQVVVYGGKTKTIELQYNSQ